MRLPIAGILCLASTLALSASALDYTLPQVAEFIAEMSTEHGFDSDELRELFAQVERKQDVLDAISRPAEKVMPWYQYRDLFITEQRIVSGVEFWKQNQAAISRVSDQTGVPADVIVAILGIETYYGRITGSHRVIDALSTLAFHYPPRSTFFRSELEQFLLLTREENIEPLAATGSYAGAMGVPQFMPSSYRQYAVDSANDGRRDLWSDQEDVLGSVANYLAVHGWSRDAPIAADAYASRDGIQSSNDVRLRPDETVASLRRMGLVFATEQGDGSAVGLITLDGKDGPEYWVGFRNFYVITRYNRSILYAMAVHQLGREISARLALEQT